MTSNTVIAVAVGGLFVLFVRAWGVDGGGRGETARRASRALTMFVAGMAGSVGAGWVAFRAGIFRSDLPSFQVFTTGALMAGVLVLTRVGRPSAARVFGIAWIVYQFGTATAERRSQLAAHMIWAVTMTAGVFIISWIWDLLLRRGVRLGKALLAGPLLGGVYLAAAPVTLLGGVSPNGALRSVLLTLLLGIVIGDGVGIGVELIETGTGARADQSAGGSP